MIKNLFILIGIIIINNLPCSGQQGSPYRSGFDDCSGKVVWVTREWKRYPEIDYDKFLTSYLNKKSSSGMSFRYDDTSLFEKFEEVIKFSNFISYSGRLNSDKVFLNVYLSRRMYQIDKSKYDLSEMVMKEPQYWTSYPRELEKAVGHDIYGLPPEDTVLEINFIDSIKLFINNKFVVIKDSIFNKLCNPNISDHFGSYRPLEVYYSPKKERIYIYIMGEIIIPNVDMDGNGKFEPELYGNIDSYISKILINPNDYTDVRDITVPGYYLWCYGWPRCADFWAF